MLSLIFVLMHISIEYFKWGKKPTRLTDRCLPCFRIIGISLLCLVCEFITDFSIRASTLVAVQLRAVRARRVIAYTIARHACTTQTAREMYQLQYLLGMSWLRGAGCGVQGDAAPATLIWTQMYRARADSLRRAALRHASACRPVQHVREPPASPYDVATRACITPLSECTIKL